MLEAAFTTAGLDPSTSYAVKVTCVALMSGAGVDDWGRPAAGDARQVRNTVQCEYRVLARLPPHRNVTRFFTQFTDTAPPGAEESLADAECEAGARLQFVVLEWHPSTLRLQCAQQPGGVALDQLWRWARDILRGQVFLRQHGAVHRDLTPAAVSVARDGRLVLGDLGYAVLLPPSLTVPLARLTEPGGHPARLAPEVHAVWARRGAAAGLVMDYSRQAAFETGVLLYELATGALPFAVPTDPAPPPALGGEYAGSLLARVMQGLVARDPAARMDVAEALDLLSGGD